MDFLGFSTAPITGEIHYRENIASGEFLSSSISALAYPSAAGPPQDSGPRLALGTS